MSKTVNFSTQLIIGGRPVPGIKGKTFETINPANGKVLANIAEASSEDIDKAVSTARKAFHEGPWSKMAPAERKKILLRFATVIEAHSEELAMMESMEAGKPITDCLEIDLPETINTIRWHAEAIDKLYDQISPSDPSVLSMIIREPIGVVAAVLPWNFPVMMAAWKIGPILATGNTVVLKPAEQTSLSTIRIAELAIEAGVPDGVINVVCGYGETVGKALGEHSDVDCVAFTGSTEIGRMFLRYSADSNLKRVLLECGGKNPFVVMGDTEDLDTAAEHATNSIFWNMGENCSSNSRLLVHESIKDELLNLYKILSPFEEVQETLKKLRKKNYKLAILSNGTPSLINKLVKSNNLENFFDDIFSIENVRVYKPSSQVYDLPIKKYNIKKNEVAFLSANTWDVCGGGNYGYEAIWVNRNSNIFDNLDYKPKLEIKNLSGLLNEF